MRNAFGLLLSALVLVPFAASAQTTPAPGTKETVAPAAGGTPGTVDATFVQTAAASGLAEVEEGQLAEKKARDKDVGTFAKQMVADHSKMNSELKRLAQQKGMALPARLDAKDAADLAALQKASGRDFDRTYMTGQVNAHEAAVALFQQEAQQGTDPQLKAFAQQGLPALQHHLAMAQQAAGHPA